MPAATTAFAIALCLVAGAPERKVPPAADELARISERGRLLAGYDAAAWHASDALQASKPKEGTVERYIARYSGQRWEVAFGKLDAARDRFLVAFEAVAGKNADEFTIKTLDPPREDSGFYRSAARAVDTALKDFVKTFKGERRPYNVAVLPAPDARLFVYLYPAPTQPGVWPLGGDVRYLLAPDGTTIVEKRQLHNAIIEEEMPAPAGANQPVSGFHTHVLDDAPEDTDVFHVLTRKPPVPEIIVTPQYVFQVDPRGKITYLGKADEILKK